MNNKHYYGGFWLRAGATVIDAVIVMIASGFINMAFGMSFMQTSTPQNVSSTAIYATLFTFVFSFLYFSIFQGLLNGSIGKKAFGLMLVDSKRYSQISIGQAFGRACMHNISGLFFGVGYIWAGINVKKQGWHDLAAGTIVVKKKHLEDLKLEAGIFPVKKVPVMKKAA